MDKKFIILSSVILFAILGLSLNFVFAKNQDSLQDQILPEQEGLYDVPGHPNLKLRVFVYHPKEKQDAKPSGGSFPTCYLQDPDSIATVGSAGWRLPAGTWTYTLNPSSVPSSVGSSNLSIISSDAFNRWSNATGNQVVFSKNLTNTSVTRAVLDGKNIITWGRASGSALGITYIWYNKTTGLASEVDTIMNTKFSWSWSNPSTWTSPAATCANSNSYDAQDILTHELGHWLGLNDYYDGTNYQNATMYGYGAKAEIKKDTLSTGDINGIEAIYP